MRNSCIETWRNVTYILYNVLKKKASLLSKVYSSRRNFIMTLEIGFQCWFLTKRNHSHGSRDTSVFLQYFNNSYIFLIFQNAENKISAELVTRTYVKNSSFKVLLYIIESPALFVYNDPLGYGMALDEFCMAFKFEQCKYIFK